MQQDQACVHAVQGDYYYFFKCFLSILMHGTTQEQRVKIVTLEKAGR